jgi:IclR family transcriptional regulator, pca regulon regulatory protein
MPGTAQAKRHKRNYIKTLDRGLRALEAFTPQSPALTLTELARRLGLDPGTAIRFAYTLEHLGYLRREPALGTYRLTSRVLDLGRAVHPEDDLRAVARPFMEALGRAVEETVSLAVRDGAEIVVLEQVESPRPVTVRRRLGERQPAHCTAQGKVLLAAMPEPELRALLKSLRLAAYGPRTLTSPAALVAELRRVRQRGYALNNDEMDAGLRAVAVPITAGGHVTAALSIDVPVGRLSLANLQAQFQRRLAETAAQIANAL